MDIKRDGVLMVSFKVGLVPLRVFSSYCTYLKKISLEEIKYLGIGIPQGQKKFQATPTKQVLGACTF